MKCQSLNLALIIFSVLLFLLIWLIFAPNVEAQNLRISDFPQFWMDWAICDLEFPVSASMYSWEIPAYTVQSARINWISPGYGAASYSANFVACLGSKCFYDSKADDFILGHEWRVSGILYIYPAYGGGIIETGNWVNADCRFKMFLPVVRR